MSPRVVSAAEWVAARKELLAAEEQAAKALTNVSERRKQSRHWVTFTAALYPRHSGNGWAAAGATGGLAQARGRISPEPRVSRLVGTSTVSGGPSGSRMRCSSI